MTCHLYVVGKFPSTCGLVGTAVPTAAVADGDDDFLYIDAVNFKFRASGQPDDKDLYDGI